MTKNTVKRNNGFQKKDKKNTEERLIGLKPLHEEHHSKHFFSSFEEWEKVFFYEVRKIEEIGKDPKKSAIEKKMEIFDILLEMTFGKLSANENERTNILLKSHFHGELAKKYLMEYKEITAKEFSKK